MGDRKNILIYVNGSMEPLKAGIRLAAQSDSWVTVLKVTPPYEGDLNLTGVRNIREVMDSNRRETIMSLRDTVRREGGRAWVRVEEGDIPETVARIARQEGADLIVMGSEQEQGFLRRLVAGRLIKQVRDQAPCPVSVIDGGREREPAAVESVMGDVVVGPSGVSYVS